MMLFLRLALGLALPTIASAWLLTPPWDLNPQRALRPGRPQTPNCTDWHLLWRALRYTDRRSQLLLCATAVAACWAAALLLVG